MDDRYELFEPYIDKARNMLHNMSVGHHDAEDIIQDALIRTSRDYDGISRPQPYFLKVVKNAALDSHKMNARRRKHLAAYRPPDSAKFPDPAILRIVEVLPDDERTVVKLTVIDGMSCRQAALELGVSHPHVSKLKKRGLAMLRERLSA